MTLEIIHGDTLAVLAEMEAESFHACVTDPPYGIGFMSRGWDLPDNVAFRPQTWTAVYHVLKPGAHLLAFCGTRTFHRLACAIDDAGFEIRDTIMWLYAAGFPKSHDVSKAIDRAAGAEREVVDFNAEAYAKRNQRRASADQHALDGGFSDADNGATITAPATEAAREWSGWGTALKPACELICVARKPLSEGTVAANVLRHGTGALNIDASRVPSDENTGRSTGHVGIFSRGNGCLRGGRTESHPNGRWPANVCHDGSPEVEGAFARFGESGDRPHTRGGQGFHNCLGRPDRERSDGDVIAGHNDTGTAARFFFCAKADASERIGNHPTVKPVALMEWLVQLVTPPGGRLLDPFCGTGSTLVACDRLGFDAVGIEQDAQTVADAREKLRRMRARRMIGNAERTAPSEAQLRFDL